MPETTLGARLRAARDAKHLSRQQLAAALGRSEKSIQNYEADETEPPASAVRDIAEATGCDPAWLLTGASAAGRVLDLDGAVLTLEMPGDDGPTRYRVSGQLQLQPV